MFNVSFKKTLGEKTAVKQISNQIFMKFLGNL